MSDQNTKVPILKSYPHHNMLSYCKNRPKYRQGRKLTAIKVLRLMSDRKPLTREVFEQKRKEHYNEFQTAKILAKQMMDEDEDENDDNNKLNEASLV